jgi:hypothetical protein
MVEMLEKDIIVLPVHDSFIVRRGFEGYLKRSMNTAFQEVINAMPRMKQANPQVHPIRNSAVLTKEEAMNLAIQRKDNHNGYFQREAQWKGVRGLEGWD